MHGESGFSNIGWWRSRRVRALHRRPAPRAPAQPLVSFTFDDCIESAATRAAPMLEERGFRGTYFVASTFMSRIGGAQAHHVRALHERGHEIGSHTFEHRDASRSDVDEFVRDDERNRSRLVELGLPPPRTFAWPFGAVAPDAKQRLAPSYTLLRAVKPGLVTRGTDLNAAPSVGIEGARGVAMAIGWLLALAAVRNAWLILYTHDVQPQHAQWGVSPEGFKAILDTVQTLKLRVVTVEEGARLVGADDR